MESPLSFYINISDPSAQASDANLSLICIRKQTLLLPWGSWASAGVAFAYALVVIGLNRKIGGAK